MSKLSIGAGSFIGRAVISAHDEIRIGDRVCINDGVKILSASHDILDPNWGMIHRPILIGDYAWIATDAVLLPGVVIGRGAVVGAGSVVTKDVPDFAVAAGNPARILRARRPEELSYEPIAFLALYRAWQAN